MKEDCNRKKGLSLGKIAKLGIGGVKAKPIRFTVTVFLFFVCLSVIGWAFTMLYINAPSSALKAYKTYKSDTVLFSLEKKEDSRSDYDEMNFDEKDLAGIKASNPKSEFDYIYEFDFKTLGLQKYETEKPYDLQSVDRCVVADDDFLTRYGYRQLYGRLPQNVKEIAIPQYLFEVYRHCGFKGGDGYVGIQTYQDLEKVKLQLTDLLNRNITVSIVGVIDTGYRIEDYEILKRDKTEIADKDWEEYQNTENRFNIFMNAGVQKAAFVHSDFIDRFVNGYELNARILDLTGHPALAYRGRAIPYSAAAEKNLVREVDGEGLGERDCYLPLGFLQKHIGYVEEKTKEEVADEIRKGLSVRMQLETVQGKYDLNEYRVVGYYEDEYQIDFVVSDAVYEAADTEKTHRTISALMTKLSDDRAANKRLMELGLSDYNEDFGYRLEGFEGNAAMQMKISKLAMSRYVPLFCAVAILFSVLMMFNFISATISAKKKEIGILRAIGTKNSSVYGIFAIESLFTAVVAFLASVGGSVLLNFAFNASINFAGGYIWYLSYGVLEAVTMLMIASAVALVGSFIPIVRLIRKKPMEILR